VVITGRQNRAAAVIAQALLASKIRKKKRSARYSYSISTEMSIPIRQWTRILSALFDHRHPQLSISKRRPLPIASQLCSAKRNRLIRQLLNYSVGFFGLDGGA